MTFDLFEDTYLCRGLIRFEPHEQGNVEFDGRMGDFIAYCENLPGVVSQGISYEDAHKNLKEAFKATIESYLSDNKTIPWRNRNEQRWEQSVLIAVEAKADE